LVAGAVLLLGALAARAQYGPPQQDPQQQAAQNEAAGYAALDQAQADPPSRVGRVSSLYGTVSVEPASVSTFTPAEVNYPMTTGDRIYADVGANAEVQTGQIAVRLGQQTDLTVTAMTDVLAQFGLAQGSVHLRSFGLDAGTTVELDTPNVAVTVLQAGDVRVDVDAANDTTVVTVLSGLAQVNGNGLEQTMNPGERLQLSGSDPVYAQLAGRLRPDGLDQFSQAQDQAYEAALGSEGQYLNPDTIGAADLYSAGDWSSDPDYGAVWYPRGVAVDWQPYRCGHWTWIAPWGWTWVECESWGFAPFHYGRWARFGPRWGWIPGPAIVRPVYSPALVVFVGGEDFAVGGVGVSAWFPLGPRETYVPWYHASTLYMNRVNVTNIFNRDTVQVRTAYNERQVNEFAGRGNGGYVNRQLATVAVPHDTFAGGRPVQGAALRVDARTLAGAAVLPHPLVTPQRTMVAPAPARALPPVLARPTLASRVDTGVRVNSILNTSGAIVRVGGTGPVNPPAQPARGGPPAATPAAPIVRPQIQPPPQPQYGRVVPQPQPAPQPTPQPMPGRVAQPEPVVAPVAPAQPARPLFNKAVPPDPRPSFDEQQRAIQANDPGRPLSPQQLNNLRQNQPAGPPQQREIPHAVPAPAPAAAPKSGVRQPERPGR